MHRSAPDVLSGVSLHSPHASPIPNPLAMDAIPVAAETERDVTQRGEHFGADPRLKRVATHVTPSKGLNGRSWARGFLFYDPLCTALSDVPLIRKVTFRDGADSELHDREHHISRTRSLV
jgi:hypothetical protein